MRKTKTKGKGFKISIGVIIAIIIAFVGYGFIFGPTKTYETFKLEKKDITLYNSFSGNIEAKTRKTLFTEGVMQIETIHVKEGDKVKVDTLLFTTASGEEILSEIDGEVVTLYVEENAQLTPGTKLVDLVDYEVLKTTIKIDEYDISGIKTGDEMTIDVQALDKEIKGVVDQVSKEAISANGISFFTATVDLIYDADLKVGMTVEAKFLKESALNVDTLPMSVLKFDDDNMPYVLTLDENDKQVQTMIEVGLNDGFFVQVISGVGAEDEVLGTESTLGNGGPFASMRNMRNAGEGDDE